MKGKICPSCKKLNDAVFKRCKYCSCDIDKVPVLSEQEVKDLERKAEELKQQLSENIANMLMTTGSNFQGYKVVEYCDVIFDELIIGMGFMKSISATFNSVGAAWFGDEANVVSDKLNEVKCFLRDRIKKKAFSLGANALLGIDFESSKIGDLIMVSMTATAVKVEKE